VGGVGHVVGEEGARDLALRVQLLMKSIIVCIRLIYVEVVVAGEA
jgi:hypothetical protein